MVAQKLAEQAPQEKVVGFIDLGTNSVRLLVARLNREFSYTVLRLAENLDRSHSGLLRQAVFADVDKRSAVLVGAI